MITENQIKERISKLKVEKAALQASHDNLVREHQQRTAQVQQIAQGNANRMQQIIGAIAQLTQMLNGDNGQNPNQEKTNEPAMASRL